MSVIGVGTDLVDIDRFRIVMLRRPAILDRIFTEPERRLAEERRDPAERYAGRFAAKEAVVKAMGIGLFRFPIREVEVLADDSGKPWVNLGETAAAFAADLGVGEFQISISHTANLAQATAVAVRLSPSG